MKRWLLWALVFFTFVNGEAFAWSQDHETLEQFVLSGGDTSPSALAAAHNHHHFCNHTCHGAAHAVGFTAPGWPDLPCPTDANPTTPAVPFLTRTIQPPIHPPNRA